MDTDVLAANAACLEQEIAWFRQVLEVRLQMHADGEWGDPLDLAPAPPLPPIGAPYAELVHRLELGPAARLVLILSCLPHVRPELLDPFFIQNRAIERRFTEFGGLLGLSHGGFLPTGETAMFLLAGDRIEARLGHSNLFQHRHPLYRENILRLDHRHRDEPLLSAGLDLTPEYRERLTTGKSYDPPFSPQFPAKRITTPYDWDDLVLPRATRDEIEDLVTWARHEDTLMERWGLKKRLKRGFRSLFYGPPGTGKTLTASLLGRATGNPVYRIDLSRVVSKYIGETEKNLASLFDHAQHQRWILYFDEAESLFGKRTESRDSKDRAANQQVSYLLQRIEDFPGIVILSTNLRSHLDEAFARRFQSMIHFPMPDVELRLRLWRDNFEAQPFPLGRGVDLGAMAREHKLSGGSIINVLRYACLKAIRRQPPEILRRDLLQAVRKEFQKEGKFLGQAG
ncbi:MAG: ATP-binding protein [Acidobacteriota bacterium]